MNLNWAHLKLFPLLLIRLFSRTHGQIFAALSQLETLISTQWEVIRGLEDYITLERRRLDALQRYLKRWETQRDWVGNKTEHLENPFSSVVVLKSLTVDHNALLTLVENHTQFEKNMSLNYPTAEDLKGATTAIIRLESTYQLNVTDLAKGILKGHYSDTRQIYNEKCAPMTASDCYEIALRSLEENDCEKALPWLIEASDQFKLTEQSQQTEFHEIIKKIIQCYKRLGYPDQMVAWRTWKNFTETKTIFLAKARSLLARTLKISRSMEKESVKTVMKKPIGAKRKNREQLTNLFASLCRGEVNISSKITKRLTCQFLTGPHPFLRLAALKLEHLYLEPSVIIFHDVISNKEIDHLKNVARPYLTRAGIIVHPKSNAHSNRGRLSMFAWIPDYVSDVVASVSRRVSHFTGMDILSSEDVQVAEYGIAGHFMPHHDFPKINEAMVPKSGGRIVTAMFYMSDVEQGGATVFTELGLTVYPKKGTALVWTNLHTSGEWDQGVYHAGCPVLRGNKWVANKWLHEAGQEFRKPCRLDIHDQRNF